jgi:hypothetical protein
MTAVRVSTREGQVDSFPITLKLRLIPEIVAGYARVRWLLRTEDFPTALAIVRGGTQLSPDAAFDDLSHARGVRLGHAVAKTLGPIPGDTRCLTRSLVLTWLLARRGIGSTFVIAVRPGADFAAHAWVEYHGKPLLLPSLEPYTRLTEL